MAKVKMNQLKFEDDGTITEEVIDTDTLEVTKVDYEILDKVDLIRLCKEKDTAIASYETERKTVEEKHNKEIDDMNTYYVSRINELKSLIRFYDRKFKMIIDITNIEKEETNNDSIQRPTKG